jgi:ABC-type cobalamin/Fe3+-siderophores transport system ATPase subunit
LHDINLAARFCGRVALLKDGRIASDGPPSEVLTPTALRNVFGAEVEVVRIDGEPHVIVGRTARAVPEPTLAP